LSATDLLVDAFLSAFDLLTEATLDSDCDAEKDLDAETDKDLDVSATTDKDAELDFD